MSDWSPTQGGGASIDLPDIYRELFHHSLDAVTVSRPDGELIDVNQAGADLLGYRSREDLLAAPIGELYVYPNDRRVLVRKLGKQGRIKDHEIWLRARDGRRLRVMGTSSALRGEDGEIAFIVSILRDVTRRRELEEALRKSEEDSRRKSRLKSEFLATLNHELRTPVTGILGATQLLGFCALDEHAEKYRRIIAASAERLHQLIDEVLDFSKIEAGALPLAPSEFDLRDLLRQVVQPLELELQARGLEWRCEIGQEVPDRLHGDAKRLGQVLTNLLTNAISFTDRGSVRAIVGIEKVENGAVWLRFRVVDTGCGIDAETLSRLFTPFASSRAPGEMGLGGTGLGMAISQRLVHLMGGDLEVTSAPGQGTDCSFALRLAVPRAERRASEVAEPAAPVPPAGQRILLVDDDEVNLKLACSLLDHLGFEAEMAASGDEALELTARKRYSLILMDCRMPGLDGLETTRRLRARENGGPRTPVVALTGNAMAGERERCLASGMDDYLAKPYTLQKLSSLLARWLGEGEREMTAGEG